MINSLFSFTKQGCGHRALACLFFCLALLLLWGSTPGFAAIIGENDWVPLSEAAEQYGFSPASVAMVLDSGGEMTCTRRDDAGKILIFSRWVGWVATVSPPVVLTVGHSLFDDDPDVARPEDRLSGCYFAVNRAVLEGDDYPISHIDPVVDRHRFGGLRPRGAKPIHYPSDRMLLPLREPIQNAIPLAMSPIVEDSVAPGDEVFFVAAARPFHRSTLRGGLEPMVAKCKVLGVESSTVNTLAPDLVMHDCDPFKGVSGGMLFRRSEQGSGDLVPLALQARMNQYIDRDGAPVDGLKAGVFDNSGIAILLEARFFDFSYKVKQLEQ